MSGALESQASIAHGAMLPAGLKYAGVDTFHHDLA